MSDSGLYQRAVTPTVEGSGPSAAVRGKMLSYQSSQMRRTLGAAGGGVKGEMSGGVMGNSSVSRGAGSSQGFGVGASAIGGLMGNATGQLRQLHQRGTDMNIQGRSATVGGGGGNDGLLPPSSTSSSSSIISSSGGTKLMGGSGSLNGLPAVPGSGSSKLAAGSSSDSEHSVAQSLAALPRYDLFPLSDEIPSDGIIFAKVRNQADSLVVFRTPEERLRNPERLNLDRRQLDVCPLLEQEQRLRLLNYQNNSIRVIQNLENLPNLIFLDLYNNKLTSLEGPISVVKGLRVLMAGKNRISSVSNLTALRKLDVLDLHSNEIRTIEGLDSLSDLRVLNLAGNRISTVQNLSSLQALTELNLRRNNIERVQELDKLPALQRIFLSHNLLVSFLDIQCLFSVKFLIELSLDGNPLSEADPTSYRNKVVGGMAGLRHLDLKRITDAERTQALQALSSAKEQEAANQTAAQLVTLVGEIPAGLSIPQSAENWSDTPGLVVEPGGWVVPMGSGGSLAEKKGNSESAGDSSSSSGLAALARSGRISSAHSLFDLELIAPNEKALIAVGETWECVQAKRLLVNVVEASLYHMRKEAVMSKFAPNMASLPALKCLRLVNNEIETLKELSFLIDSLGRGVSALEHLIIKDSPICSSASGLLRHFVCAILPNLKSFNELEISILERAESIKMIAPVLKVQDLAISQHYFGQTTSQSEGAADQSSQQPVSRAGNVSSMRLRQTQAPSSKRPSASMGNRSVTAESYEASIDQLVSEISASASSSKVKEKWEAALAKAVHQIFKESVFNLTKS